MNTNFQIKNKYYLFDVTNLTIESRIKLEKNILFYFDFVFEKLAVEFLHDNANQSINRTVNTILLVYIYHFWLEPGILIFNRFGIQHIDKQFIVQLTEILINDPYYLNSYCLLSDKE